MADYKLVPVEPTPQMMAAAIVSVVPPDTHANITICIEAAKLIIKELGNNSGVSEVAIACQIASMIPFYKAMIEAAPSPWQPIETAPKDETRFLVYCNRIVMVAMCYMDEWCDDHGKRLLYFKPEFWMPLPEAPK